MTLQNPPSFLQNRTDHTAQQDRLTLRGVMVVGGTEGIAISAGINLVRQQPVAAMSVLVAREGFWIRGSQNTHQGLYHAYNDGDVTVTIAASSPSQPRIDIVCIQVEDSFYSGSNNDVIFTVVTGTPSGTPVAPSAPANSLTLAQISVAANATSIVDANIIQTSTVATARGGIIPVPNQATRDALASPYEGMYADRADTNALERYTGSAWESVYRMTRSYANSAAGGTFASGSFQDIVTQSLPSTAPAGRWQVATTVSIWGSVAGQTAELRILDPTAASIYDQVWGGVGTTAATRTTMTGVRGFDHTGGAGANAIKSQVNLSSGTGNIATAIIEVTYIGPQ